ncbi:MAG: hypothetical protein GEV07_12670 [Streptosporangiales bacterium]|nr:hypothetical protein [Streptosporangiales bacterium]
MAQQRGRHRAQKNPDKQAKPGKMRKVGRGIKAAVKGLWWLGVKAPIGTLKWAFNYAMRHPVGMFRPKNMIQEGRRLNGQFQQWRAVRAEGRIANQVPNARQQPGPSRPVDVGRQATPAQRGRMARLAALPGVRHVVQAVKNVAERIKARRETRQAQEPGRRRDGRRDRNQPPIRHGRPAQSPQQIPPAADINARVQQLGQAAGVQMPQQQPAVGRAPVPPMPQQAPVVGRGQALQPGQVPQQPQMAPQGQRPGMPPQQAVPQQPQMPPQQPGQVPQQAVPQQPQMAPQGQRPGMPPQQAVPQQPGRGPAPQGAAPQQPQGFAPAPHGGPPQQPGGQAPQQPGSFAQPPQWQSQVQGGGPRAVSASRPQQQQPVNRHPERSGQRPGSGTPAQDRATESRPQQQDPNRSAR